MTHHIILWKLKDEFSESEKSAIKEGIKNGLESLAGKIPGLISISVKTTGLPSSNVDLMLDSVFTCAEALKNYSVNPLHVEVANTKVRPFTAGRYCLDFED